MLVCVSWFNYRYWLFSTISAIALEMSSAQLVLLHSEPVVLCLCVCLDLTTDTGYFSTISATALGASGVVGICFLNSLPILVFFHN